MKKTILFSFALLFNMLVVYAQSLKSFTVTMQSNDKAYLSFTKNKSYTAGEALPLKDDIDLALVLTKKENTNTLEWYNLKKDNEKVPEALTGTTTSITAITFDKDQFDKCKTIADLTRMTGHITKNSFSHFAVISNTGAAVDYTCFLAQTENGKRALLYVTALAENKYQVTVKLQP